MTPTLQQHDIERFRELYRESFGIELDEQAALEKGLGLLQIISLSASATKESITIEHDAN